MAVRNDGGIICDALGAGNCGMGVDNVVVSGGTGRILIYRELPLNVKD